MTRQRLRRLGWNFLDQGLVSATGSVVTVQGAATLPPAEFGQLSAALAAYYFLLTTMRALVSEVYMVRFAGAPDRVPPGVARWAQAITVRFSLVPAAGVLALAVVAPISAGGRRILLALAVALPLLLWQEVRRSVLLASARPARSAASSGLVLAGQLVGGLVLHVTVGTSGAALLLSWAASAALAVGCVPASVDRGRRGGPVGIRRWLADGRAYWPRFLAQDMAQGGASQVALLLVAAAAGTVVVGGIRAALLLLAPLLVLQQAAVQFALAEATRVPARQRRRFVAVCQAGGVIAGTGWLLVLDLTPRAGLHLVVGDNLTAGLSALPGMALFVVGSLLLAAPVAALRGSGQVQAGMALGLALVPVLLGGPTVVAVLGGSAAEVAGAFGAFGVLSSLVWTLACVVILRRPRSGPAAVRPATTYGRGIGGGRLESGRRGA